MASVTNSVGSLSTDNNGTDYLYDPYTGKVIDQTQSVGSPAPTTVPTQSVDKGPMFTTDNIISWTMQGPEFEKRLTLPE